jgi:hypothetical protein
MRRHAALKMPHAASLGAPQLSLCSGFGTSRELPPKDVRTFTQCDPENTNVQQGIRRQHRPCIATCRALPLHAPRVCRGRKNQRIINGRRPNMNTLLALVNGGELSRLAAPPQITLLCVSGGKGTGRYNKLVKPHIFRRPPEKWRWPCRPARPAPPRACGPLGPGARQPRASAGLGAGARTAHGHTCTQNRAAHPPSTTSRHYTRMPAPCRGPGTPSRQNAAHSPANNRSCDRASPRPPHSLVCPPMGRHPHRPSPPYAFCTLRAAPAAAGKTSRHTALEPRPSQRLPNGTAPPAPRHNLTSTLRLAAAAPVPRQPRSAAPGGPGAGRAAACGRALPAPQRPSPASPASLAPAHSLSSPASPPAGSPAPPPPQPLQLARRPRRLTASPAGRSPGGTCPGPQPRSCRCCRRPGGPSRCRRC